MHSPAGLPSLSTDRQAALIYNPPVESHLHKTPTVNPVYVAVVRYNHVYSERALCCYYNSFRVNFQAAFITR